MRQLQAATGVDAATTLIDDVAQFSAFNRYLVSKSLPDEKIIKGPVPANSDPFPKVDDIADRLSNRLTNAQLPIRANS